VHPRVAATRGAIDQGVNHVATYASIDHPISRVDLRSIQLVSWPSERERRAELAAGDVPVLLLVEPDAPPPRCAEHEDWLREPATLSDLQARLATMHDRRRCGAEPSFDDGLLVHRGAWVSVPDGQVPIVELLLARYGSVVDKVALTEAARRGGGSVEPEAVKTTMLRLARRLKPIGVRVEVIRGRGYLLHTDDRCPVHHQGGAKT
jgi:two-component system OmpR family response regulator